MDKALEKLKTFHAINAVLIGVHVRRTDYIEHRKLYSNLDPVNSTYYQVTTKSFCFKSMFNN